MIRFVNDNDKKKSSKCKYQLEFINYSLMRKTIIEINFTLLCEAIIKIDEIFPRLYINVVQYFTKKLFLSSFNNSHNYDESCVWMKSFASIFASKVRTLS